MDASVNGRGKNTSDGIKEAIDDVREKNAKLRETMTYLRQENAFWKLRHNKLKHQLGNLSTLLEKNVKVLSELFVNTKSALQICTVPILNSPVVQKRSPVSVESPKPGPSVNRPPLARQEHVTRRKLHIEPMDMGELQVSECADSDKLPEPEETSDERLTTILEESSKELTVVVDRLPLEVVMQHLKKSNCSITSLDDLSVSLLDDPTFASTPLKLATMEKLGLMPSPRNVVHQFVSVRKKDGGRLLSPKKDGGRLLSPKKDGGRLLSPKKEIISSPQSSVSKKENSVKKPQKRKADMQQPNNSPPPEGGRPTRKAKPKVLKEESLRT